MPPCTQADPGTSLHTPTVATPTAKRRKKIIVLAARLRARAVPTTTLQNRFAANKEGGEAPKGALSYQSPLARRRIHDWTRPPVGASPRHSPPALAPMAHPQNRVSRS